MSLELIIQQIKAIGNLLPNSINLEEDYEKIQKQARRYRVKIGNQQFISRRTGQFISQNQLIFDEAFSYIYDGNSHLLFLEIFKQHHFLDNSDLDEVMYAEVDLSDLTNLNGDYIQTSLQKTSGQHIGKLILTVQTFKKGNKYSEKVSSKMFFEAVKEIKQVQASAAARNIKNLIVNNTLTDTLMTINAMTLILQKEDNQIFMRDGFILIKYGLSIRAYSSLLKISSKENVNWTDYIQFMKNDGVKFEFFFFHNDQLGNLTCKAKGQIKYVIFDQTINLHTITMCDKRSNKYGVLMVKFIQKNVDKVNINNKLEKKIKDQQPIIQNCIEEFNQFKFQNKNNGHILSQKLWELEQRQQALMEEKQRPLNPEEKKKNQEHTKFIQFIQKQMIKIQRELAKRQQNNKKGQRKSSFLPTINEKRGSDSRVSPRISPDSRVSPIEKRQRYDRNMNSSFSSTQFAGLKLPKI